MTSGCSKPKIKESVYRMGFRESIPSADGRRFEDD